MTIIEQGGSAGLVDRVKAILTKPNPTWDVIAAEPASVSEIYKRYVIPLAAIPPVCTLIGGALIGHSLFGISYHTPIISGLVLAIVSYVLSLAMVYVMSLIIDALAPSFDGTKSPIQAFKVAAYSMTASWVVGVFGILPALAPLAILGGLYGLYLLYLGLPKLMQAPTEKALGYTAVTIICAIVMSIVIGAVAASIGGMAILGSAVGSHVSDAAGTVKVGGAEIDLGKLTAASKQMEAQANALQAQAKGDAAGAAAAGAVQAVPGDTLKGMLPAAVGAFARSEVSSTSAGAAGLGGTNAEGVYARGSDQLTLSITDMASAKGLMGMAGAFNVTSSKETATGYEKMGKVDGRMTSEEYDRTAKSGEYSVVVADRFMVKAHGNNVSMDELKAAVSSVGLGQLEGMAKS
jgi:hypothetical protein